MNDVATGLACTAFAVLVPLMMAMIVWNLKGGSK